jgi:hypothetical protein
MSEHENGSVSGTGTVSADAPEEGSAGTDCALCGQDISPNQYRRSRAILVDESGPGGEEEAVKMVCRDCWTDLEEELSIQSE